MDWIDKLEDVLAIEAHKHFGDSKPGVIVFREYITTLTTIVDWDDEFIDKIYMIYLSKINAAGSALTKKINEG